MVNKIKSIEEIEAICKRLKEEGKTIITTNGSFDILHAAHINLLEKAKEEGDVLIVLLNSDSSVRRNKGEKRPIVPEYERARMLAALASVDYVTIFYDDKPLSSWEKIKPHINARGGSYDPERMDEEKAFISRWGGRYKNFELEEGFSTTNIIQRIVERIDLKVF